MMIIVRRRWTLAIVADTICCVLFAVLNQDKSNAAAAAATATAVHRLLSKRELASIFGVNSRRQVPYYEIAFIKQQHQHLKTEERWRRSAAVQQQQQQRPQELLERPVGAPLLHSLGQIHNVSNNDKVGGGNTIQLSMHTPNRTLTLSLSTATSLQHDAQLPPHFKLIIREDANHSTQFNLTELNEIAARAAAQYNAVNALQNDDALAAVTQAHGEGATRQRRRPETAGLLCMFKGQAIEQQHNVQRTTNSNTVGGGGGWIKRRLKKYKTSSSSGSNGGGGLYSNDSLTSTAADADNIIDMTSSSATQTNEGRVALTGCPGEEGMVGIITTPYEHLMVQPIPERLYDFIDRSGYAAGGGQPHFLIPIDFQRASLTMPPRMPSSSSASSPLLFDDAVVNNKHFCGVDKVPVPVELARIQQEQKAQSSSRAKRAITSSSASSSSGFKLYIETAAFLDHKLYTYLLDKTFVNSYDAIVKFVFAIVNTVQHLYNEPSLGYDFDIVLVRLEILKSPNMPFYSEEVDKYLWDFCKWQSTVNPGTDLGDPDHWDHAIILTGFDLRSGSMRSVTGYAPVGGMCNPMYSCTINEGHHFGAAFVIAHEMGHSLGMQHDGQTGMDGNVCDAQKFIMSSSTGRGKTTWSPCSRSYLSGFISQERSTCLKDQPVIHDPNLDHDMGVLPGQMYSADKQCQMLYGMAFQKYPLQPNNEVCDMLICANKTVYITGHPALEGTQCGENYCCIGGTCQFYKSQNSSPTSIAIDHAAPPPTENTPDFMFYEANAKLPHNNNHSPSSSPADGGTSPAFSPPSAPPPSLPFPPASSQVVDGGWSDWPDTVPCTSTCLTPATGLFIYERQCNNPAPQNGGRPCSGGGGGGSDHSPQEFFKTLLQNLVLHANIACVTTHSNAVAVQFSR